MCLAVFNVLICALHSQVFIGNDTLYITYNISVMIIVACLAGNKTVARISPPLFTIITFTRLEVTRQTRIISNAIHIRIRLFVFPIISNSDVHIIAIRRPLGLSRRRHCYQLRVISVYINSFRFIARVRVNDVSTVRLPFVARRMRFKLANDGSGKQFHANYTLNVRYSQCQ